MRYRRDGPLDLGDPGENFRPWGPPLTNRPHGGAEGIDEQIGPGPAPVGWWSEVTNGHVFQNGLAVELHLRGSALVLSVHPERRDSGTVEILHQGERLVLGHDWAAKIHANFLDGLDHRRSRPPMDYGVLAPLAGQKGFYFQGLASTSAIYAAYLPNGVLRLLVRGSQVKRDLDVTLDLSPDDRASWRQGVMDWFERVTPPS